MASLSNQQYNTKSMSGLNDVYSNNIVCDTIEVADEFTLDPGGILTLPPNSVQDSYLSNNVAFRNQANTFTLANTFTNTVQFTSTTIPIITQSIPANDATTKIPTTQWTNTYYGELTKPLASTIQTWFGQNRFSTSGSNLPVLLRNTDQPTYAGGLLIASGNGQFNATILLGDTVLLSSGTGIDTGGLSLTTYSVTNCGIRIGSSNVTYNGTNHNFNGNVNLKFPSLLNVWNATSDRGMQIQNDNTNGGLTLFRGVGNSTRFNFFSNNASGVATNNFYISNGDTCSLQGADNLGIGLSGANISLQGICSFTNTTTPVITQAISLVDNSTKISTTAFVKGQGYITSSALTPYALLNPVSQTFTGINNFPTQLTTDNSTLVATTAYVKNQGYITSSALSPYALLNPVSQTFTGNNNFPTQLTTDNSTLVATTAYVKNQGYITSSALTPYALLAPVSQTFTGNNNFPTQLTTDNSTLVATTAYVKNQGYITSSALSPYALLNPAALQIWGTNENQFNTQVTMNVVGTRYLNGTDSSSITQTGNTLILTGISNASSIQLRSRTSGGVVSNNVIARNGNEIVLRGDTGVVRVLDTACTIECGTFSSEAPYNCGYLQLAGPITSKTNYNIGYQFTIPGASLNSGWAAAVTAYNIFTIVWNGTGDYTLGVWQCDIVIVTNATTAPSFSLCWNTISNTSMDITEKCAQSTALTTFNSLGYQITRLSFVLNITNLLQTFWLNSFKAAGAGLFANTSYSQIKFTRLG
jgi:hypothetical protein